MKKSISKFTRTGFTCLSLFASAAAASAQDAFKAGYESAFPAEEGTRVVKSWTPLDDAPSWHPVTEMGTQDASVPSLQSALTTPSLSTAFAASGWWGTGFFPASGPASAASDASGTVPAATMPTSGTLNTATSSNYSTAPWVITAGDGTYPDLGGTATFNSELGATPGTVPSATVTITLDVSPTLGAVVVNNPFVEVLAGSTTTSLIMPSTGTTFTLNDGTNSPSYSLFDFQEGTTGIISGGGSAGLTTTGSGGSILLEGTNTYTGGTHIGAGSVVGVLNSDANLGATGAGNGIEINGGQFDNDYSGYTTARNIQLDGGGGTFLLFYAMTDSGVVSGPGNLSIDNQVLTLTGANTYTGATLLTSDFGGLTLSGTGTANASSSYDLSGTITLDNTATNVNNRLSATAPITDRGATFVLNGNATAATTEADGALTLADGVGTFTVTPNAAEPATLSFASITRQNAATMFVRGTGLGATAANGVGEIISVASPGTLIGGGGAAASTSISILPWAIGNTSATATASSSFVTYDPVTGQFRPLATTEYSTLTSGESDTNNTVVTAATAIAAATTVNAVKVTGTGTLLSGTGGLTITSGDLLYSPASTTAGTISANLNFGTAEGIISTTAGAANSTTAALTVSGVISGSGGLTINPVIGSDIKITGANTYTGTTTLLAGLTQISGTIASDGVTAGPFGLSTSAVVLNVTGNSNLNGLYATAATTFNRPLSVVGGTNGGAAILLIGGAYAFTFNGAVSVPTGTELAAYDTATGSATNGFIYNNVISGGGILSDEASGTFTVLNAPNTYSGGTNMYAGTYVVGIDSTTDGNGNTTSGAFGTGTIYNSDGAKISSLGTAAHTVSNPLVLAYTTATFSGTGALTFTGPVNLDGAKTLAISNTAGTTFTGVVSNGSVTKTGTGPLAFNSSTGNTYTGGTVLGNNVGVLLGNNSSGSAFGTGAVSIGATSATTYSTLAGNFTTSGNTSVAGRLSPGAGGLTAATAGIGSIGALTFSNNLTLSSSTTSSLYMEVGSSASYDTINVGGTFALAGTVYIATTNGYTIQSGDVYTIVNAGSITPGTYTFNTANATLASGVTLTEMVTTTQVIVDAVAVPEPTTVLGGLFTAGLLVLGVRRRVRPAGKR